LINAKKIVVLTPTLRQKLYKNLDDDAIKIIDKKVVIIPNPIADFWFEQKLKEKKEDKNKVKLVQIGQLSKNKNNISVLKAINNMIKDKKQISYTIMGNGPIEDELKDYVKENKLEDYVTFTGYIKDKEKIQQYLLENDIFIMPSKSETFGLVYIEAMSQGLPVIYTKGQGIDGLFESQVGYGVDPEDIQGIIEAIGKIYNNYQILSKNAINQAKRLTASNIAKRYIDVWEEKE
jgi:glycosyltransferase involved in cell wall biosynthesis